jgi:heme A synthase
MTTNTMSTPSAYSPSLHRYAVFVALFVLIAIIAGAIVTSLERPLASTTAAAVGPTAVSFEFWHQVSGALAAILMIVLAFWVATAITQSRIRRFAWCVLAVTLAEPVLGTQSVLRSFLPLTGILHALLAHLSFVAVVAIALLTSESWLRGPEPVVDSWRPSLRSLSIAVPAIVLLQITLGAAFRYHALGVIWHILNAMIVLLLILVVAVFLIRQFPQHKALRQAAHSVAGLAGVQVLLGFTTFLMLLLFPETSLSVIITSVAHVATGALTFAASVVLALQIRRDIAASEVTHRSVTAK